MSLHPDIIDAMVAAGASAGMDPGAVLAMVQAACRAAWNVVNTQGSKPTGIGEQAADRVLGAVNDRPCSPRSSERETPRDMAEEMRSIAAAMHALDGEAQRDATDATLHATVQRSSTGRPQSSTERSRKHRAAKTMQRATVSTALHSVASVAPLSLDLSLKANTDSKVKNCGEIALPADWRPDDKSKAEAAPLGEAAAAVMTANFCDYYWARPELRKTPAAWQSKYRTAWARKELQHLGSRQGKLPLMRRVGNRDDPSHLWKFERAYQETMARRRESG
jgi:hypothetical protein